VNVDEVEAWRGAPAPEETRLDMLLFERLAQQRIVEQVNLTDRQIIGGAPVSIDERFRLSTACFRFSTHSPFSTEWSPSSLPSRAAAAND
jgi:hypothetical protein